MSWKNSPTQAVQPYQTIPFAEKKQRKSDWNKIHAPKSFSIPPPLIQAAIAVREKILSCAEFDEQDNRRTIPFTADVVANVILEWALDQVKQKPKLIPVSPTPHSKVGMTAYAAAWDTWRKPPTFPKSTLGKKKSKRTVRPAKFYLAYRIPASMESEIKKISEETGVPLGEVFLRLLQIGLAGYENMDFRIVPTPEVSYRSATYERRTNE
jgi:hypothetical protein